MLIQNNVIKLFNFLGDWEQGNDQKFFAAFVDGLKNLNWNSQHSCTGQTASVNLKAARKFLPTIKN